jgi:hypothetical protein
LYNIAEANGHTNLSLQNGSVVLWFKPDWSSVDQGGTGPGIISCGPDCNLEDWGALVEVDSTVDSTGGFWELYFDPFGTNLWFSSGDGTNWSGDLIGNISWVSNQWHQIAVTYSPSNSTLYVDGTAIAQTNGVPYIPVFDNFPAQNYFTVGNDVGEPVNGTIDELETLNYPLDQVAIFRAYTNAPSNINILSQPQTQSVMVGSNANFSLTATSVFPLFYQWYFNTNSPVAGATNPSLTFTVQATNRGNYRVVVSNILTSAASTDAFLSLFGDSDSNSLGDDWEMQYFSHIGNDPRSEDGAGNTLLYDYTNGLDPISFIPAVTNNFVNTTSVPVNLFITGGIPYYYSCIADPTNFEGVGSNWNSYVSSNITATFAPTTGKHQIWIGLAGPATNAPQAWMEVLVTFDTNPPVITVTNPAPGATVSEPMIQIQGRMSEELSSLTFDITNAAGLLTNQTGYITGEFYDTNAAAFTTNYFQLYDVAVTNGANAITIHAIDLAGNLSSTNINVILDYSSDTNPPSLALVWPQNGAKIAGNNFTLQAKTDDNMASVTATIVDSSGNTNIIPGAVHRNGNVWLQNMPLASGTNSLTLTATDPAGNSSTTTLNVIGNSAVTITMAEISGSQLNLASIDASGKINDPTDTVVANGVRASVDSSGNWTANGVQVNPTGMASVQVDVYDSTSNFLGSDTFDQQEPAVVTRTVYMDHLDSWANTHFGTFSYVTNDANNQPVTNTVAQDCWKFSQDLNDLQWTEDGGASQHLLNVLDNRFCSDPNFVTDQTLYWATNDMSWTSVAPWWPGPSYADAVVSQNTVGQSGSYELHAHSGYALDDNAEDKVGTVATHFVSFSTSEPGFFFDGAVPPPPQWSKARGLTGIDTGVIDTNNEGANFGLVPITGPAGARFDLALNTAQFYTNNKLATYNFQQTQRATILANGIDLSTTTPQFCVGQIITFAPKLDAIPGVQSKTYQWKFNGNFANDGTNAFPGLTYPLCSSNYFINTNLFTNQMVTNWWISGGYPSPGTPYTAQLTISLTFSNGLSITDSVSGSFNMFRPSVTATAKTGLILVDTNWGGISISRGVLVLAGFGLHYGSATTTNGITFSETMDAAPFSSGSTINWVQVLNNVSAGRQLSDGSWYSPFTQPINEMLDVRDPASTLSALGDPPGQRGNQTNDLSLTENFNATMWLLFAPNGGQRVPLCNVTWYWSGTAVRSGTNWSLTSSNQNVDPSFANTEMYPVWTNNVTNFINLPFPP